MAGNSEERILTCARQKKLESGFSVLREAVAAIDGSTLRGLERNFALFAAVGTDCLVELAGAVLKRAGTPARISLIHWDFTHMWETVFTQTTQYRGFLCFGRQSRQ